MKLNKIKWMFGIAALSLTLASCHDLLDAPKENQVLTNETDYTISDNMILPVIGMYGQFYQRGWEDFPLMQVRGDDVNAGGLGDQQDYSETDKYNYNKDYWMYNSVWQNMYADIFTCHSAMEQVELYREAGGNSAKADQYIAEAKTVRAFLLFNLTRTWGKLLIPTTSSPSDLLVAELQTPEAIYAHICDELDAAIPNLPAVHPADRSDIKGGVTKFTALAVKALAKQELKDYQGVADAAAQIISSGKFELESDYYNLFKIKGKLNRENVLEMQYSDWGLSTGDQIAYLFAFYGPQNWTPKVNGSNGGWGFYEPSLKYIKFMVARGDSARLRTNVIFTNAGIEALKSEIGVANVPDWVSNTTPSGDIFLDMPREMFLSGKHYLPSDQLTTGRTDYGNNKNFTLIRYAEILLMYAEALTNGATNSTMTAVAAVNLVRQRAGMEALSSVNAQQVLDEKFAELAMEGTRYFDMVRLGKYTELSYEGRTFDESKIYLPYPQNQVDILPPLQNAQ